MLFRSTLHLRLPKNMQPFRLLRKASAMRADRKYFPTRRIVSVVDAGVHPARCITVAADDGLYVADRFVVTHNSWFGVSGPAPRLVLDSEGGSRFTPGRKITWDPAAYAPPEAPVDDSWDTCIVTVHNWSVVERVMAWLQSGQHPFRTVVLDSLTEKIGRAHV